MEKVLKVLFVVSGNSNDFLLSPFIKAQGESLVKKRIDVSYFLIQNKGVIGYLKNIKKLKTYLKSKDFDLIHAHYMLCGWVAVLANPKIPIVLSLMGDDAYGTYYKHKKIRLFSRYLTLLTILIQPFLKGIIAKSKNINNYVYRKNIAQIIPNGVNLNVFIDHKRDFRDELGLEKSKKYILFLGDPQDENKNFSLIKSAFDMISNDNIQLLNPFPISQELVVKYLWSVDLFVLASFKEGSANVIKEAMVCNCPIVATNAGDAKWVIDDTEGCYIADYGVDDYAEKIKWGLEFANKNIRTQGRKRIIALGLDSDSVAKKIINIYNRS